MFQKNVSCIDVNNTSVLIFDDVIKDNFELTFYYGRTFVCNFEPRQKVCCLLGKLH